jgi:hypothetical protein
MQDTSVVRAPAYSASRADHFSGHGHGHGSRQSGQRQPGRSGV